MRWIDVTGCPGSGKSALCDPLWAPHAIHWTGDGLGVPAEWDDFLEVCDSLLKELEDHPTYHLLTGMTKRSLRKMATVYRMPDDGPVYIQTGLAQRGLGFGWRLEERGRTEMLRKFYKLMPVSLGVALLDCPVEVAMERNRLREQNPATAHENRAHMVPLMQRPIQIMLEELYARGVPVAQIDATKPLDNARQDLLRFAAERAVEAAQARLGGEVEAIQQHLQPGDDQDFPVAHRASA